MKNRLYSGYTPGLVVISNNFCQLSEIIQIVVGNKGHSYDRKVPIVFLIESMILHKFTSFPIMERQTFYQINLLIKHLDVEEI